MSNFIAQQLTNVDAATAAKYSPQVEALHVIFPDAKTFGDLLGYAARAAASSHGSVGILFAALLEDRHLIEGVLSPIAAQTGDAHVCVATELVDKYRPLVLDVFNRLVDDYTLKFTPGK